MNVLDLLPIIKKYKTETNEYQIKELNKILVNCENKKKYDKFGIYFYIESILEYKEFYDIIIKTCYEFDYVCQKILTGKEPTKYDTSFVVTDLFSYFPIFKKYDWESYSYHINNLACSIFKYTNYKFTDEYYFNHITENISSTFEFHVTHHINELMGFREKNSIIMQTCIEFEAVCDMLKNGIYNKPEFNYTKNKLPIDVNLIEEIGELKPFYDNYHISCIERILFKLINSDLYKDNVLFDKIYNSNIYSSCEKDILYHLKHLLPNKTKLTELNELNEKIIGLVNKYKNSHKHNRCDDLYLDLDSNLDLDFSKINMTICI